MVFFYFFFNWLNMRKEKVKLMNEEEREAKEKAMVVEIVSATSFKNFFSISHLFHNFGSVHL